jgi:hypothetical protein
MIFNINHSIRVKVTLHGYSLLPAERAKMVFKESSKNDGWSRWQLWDLISTFGGHLHIGCEIPFETNIEIPEEPKFPGKTEESP